MSNINNFVLGNGRENNKQFTIDAGSSVVLHFKDSGADTDSDRYYDLQKAATKVSVRVNQIATITHIGNHELDSPITLGTSTNNSFTEGFQWTIITVRADVDATNFEVVAY